MSVGIGFSNFEGTRLLSYDTDFQESFRPDLPSSGTHVVEIEVDALQLAPDIYNLDVGLSFGDSIMYRPVRR